MVAHPTLFGCATHYCESWLLNISYIVIFMSFTFPIIVAVATSHSIYSYRVTMLHAGLKLANSVYHMYICYCCCVATMFHAGLVDSVCHVLLLLSGEHASCGSWWKCIFVLLLTCLGYADYYCLSGNNGIIPVWWPCFIQVIS